MLSQHDAIPVDKSRRGTRERLQEEKLKVRLRNVNTRRAPAIPVPARHRFEEAKPKLSSPTLGGCARRWKVKRKRKKKGRRRETLIAYRAVERDKSTKIEIGKTGVVTRAWIGSKLAISQGSLRVLGLVPNLISITTTSSLPTDYRLQTMNRLPTAGAAQCTMAHLEDDVAENEALSRKKPSCIPFLTRNYVNFSWKNYKISKRQLMFLI